MNENNIYKRIDDGIEKWEDSWITREKPWIVICVLFFTHVIPLAIIVSVFVMKDNTLSYPLMGAVTVLMICFVFWTFHKLRYRLAYKTADITGEKRVAIIEKKLKWIRILSWGYVITGILLLAGSIIALNYALP